MSAPELTLATKAQASPEGVRGNTESDLVAAAELALATVAHGAAFSANTPTSGAIAEVVLMSPGAVTHGFNQNQRYVGCVITGTTATTVDATAPPNGNIAPPGYHLLFLVDHDRVPSIAQWIRLTP